jgi:hypothetical protein
MSREDTQFKPGTSGNIKGRPPKKYHIGDWLERITSEEVAPGKDSTTKLEWILRLIVRKAMSGEKFAIDFLADRMEGKPRQTIIQQVRQKDSIILVEEGDTVPEGEDYKVLG